MKNSFSNKFVMGKVDKFKIEKLSKSKKKQQDSKVEKGRSGSGGGRSIIPSKTGKPIETIRNNKFNR